MCHKWLHLQKEGRGSSYFLATIVTSHTQIFLCEQTSVCMCIDSLNTILTYNLESLRFGIP